MTPDDAAQIRANVARKQWDFDLPSFCRFLDIANDSYARELWTSFWQLDAALKRFDNQNLALLLSDVDTAAALGAKGLPPLAIVDDRPEAEREPLFKPSDFMGRAPEAMEPGGDIYAGTDQTEGHDN